MGYHDRDKDNNYSNSLRPPKSPHPYDRLRAHEDTAYVATITGHIAPAKPHKRFRRIALPAAGALPDGTPVVCIKNPGTGGASVVTIDGSVVGAVHPLDAKDLRGNLDKGFIPGKSLKGNVDLELEE